MPPKVPVWSVPPRGGPVRKTRRFVRINCALAGSDRAGAKIAHSRAAAKTSKLAGVHGEGLPVAWRTAYCH